MTYITGKLTNSRKVWHPGWGSWRLKVRRHIFFNMLWQKWVGGLPHKRFQIRLKIVLYDVTSYFIELKAVILALYVIFLRFCFWFVCDSSTWLCNTLYHAWVCCSAEFPKWIVLQDQKSRILICCNKSIKVYWKNLKLYSSWHFRHMQNTDF